MPNEETLTPAERELQEALGTLQPAAAGIDRDGLMFRAGRASVRRALRPWQAASVVLAACLAISLWARPKRTETVRIVRAPLRQRLRKPPAPPGRAQLAAAERVPAPPPDDPSARLCEDVLRRGLDALPTEARSSRAAPLSVAQLLGTPRVGRGQFGLLERLGLRPMGERR